MKRWCQLCRGYGYTSVCMDITEKCKACGGEGRIDWPTEWRPYEQCKPEYDEYCSHMRGAEGSCARCEGT